MVIANALICDAHSERLGDVKIQDGVIVEIGDSLRDDEIIDGSGCYLLPGLIDTNVSLKDAQLNGKNITALAATALQGGVSTVVLNSDMMPKIDNEITLEFVHQHQNTKAGAVIECSISALNDAGTLSNIAILLKKGAFAVSTSTLCDYNLISRIAQYLQMHKKPLFYTSVDKSLFESGVMADGSAASRLGLSGISPLSEIVHVASMIEVARHFGIKIIFKSITEPRSIELISKAIASGIDVACEVGVHHLLKNDSACIGYDSDAKINPPLVSEEKRSSLIRALKAGDIHSLSALHQPNSDIHKDITFNDASFGTTSIGEYLPLCYTYLIKNEIISMSHLMELASKNPAQSVGMSKGAIEIGMPADLILFNPHSMTQVTHHHSLYKNEILHGRVMMAIQGEAITRF
ncbi:MAG TPA: amidohydrolase family protein [Sulfuricurvum sp.]|nr:amidohydrolase family protein [Sulfuricurvum sp.]